MITTDFKGLLPAQYAQPIYFGGGRQAESCGKAQRKEEDPATHSQKADHSVPELVLAARARELAEVCLTTQHFPRAMRGSALLHNYYLHFSYLSSSYSTLPMMLSQEQPPWGEAWPTGQASLLVSTQQGGGPGPPQPFLSHLRLSEPCQV